MRGEVRNFEFVSDKFTVAKTSKLQVLQKM
jgi:hypothetical protein